MFARLPTLLLALFLFSTACGDCGTDKPYPYDDVDVAPGDDTSIPDSGHPDDDASTSDDSGPDADTDTDTGPTPTDEVVVTCNDNTWQPPSSGELCDTTPGTGGAVLFQVGRVLTPDAVYANGTVLIDGTGDNATISCVGCDCADQADTATVVTCADGTLSPALINPHDHITFSLSWPQQHGTERFDHRHDWREGLRGHNEVRLSPGADSSRTGVLYGELRMLFGGATSVAGSSTGTDTSGLLRNLDDPSHTEGLVGVDVDYRTFPLGDSSGALRANGCDYPNIDAPTRAANAPIYMPHLAEGIDNEANNEFRCLTTTDHGGVDLLGPNTTIVHGIGLSVTDIAQVAAEGAKLVWSPRSNIDLYGNTARVTTYKSFGTLIALGTDWSASGSANMLRELKCADYLNENYYDRAFTDRELWMMTTYNAAVAMGADTQIGVIAPGFIADLALFDGRIADNYRAVIEADNEHVHLVMRGGAPLYGDANVIEALVPASEISGCEEIDVCGNERRLCVERDTGLTRAAINGAVNQNAYPQFFCGTPQREPSCEPFRPDEYTGITADDIDGDGIPDGDDLCPAVFTPIRPMDSDRQNDIDGDQVGDDCDQCPLSEDSTCGTFDPNDRDGDGVPNISDNCPDVPNPDQANSDGDQFGDACDPCPDFDNSTSLACPATIYDIRAGDYGVGDSVLLEDVVVTASGARSYFVQVPPTASYYSGVEHSGLYIYGAPSDPMPAVGDIVHVEGRLDIFGDTLEVVTPTTTVVSQNNPLPDFTEVTPAEVATNGPRSRNLEGTLIRIRDVTVTNENPDAPDDFGVFEVDGFQVDDVFFAVTPRPSIGEEFAILQGVLMYSFGNSKLLPRDAQDVVTGPPALAALSPDHVFLRAGGSVVPPLEVVLAGPSLGTTTVDLTYTGDVSGPATIDIPDGATSAIVPLTATGTSAGTVTATLGGDTVDADVTIYSDAVIRAVETIEAVTNVAPPNGSVLVTVTLDFPASTTGDTVTITTTGAASAPATVVFAADQLSASFTVDVGPNPDAIVVTASLNASSEATTIDVVAGTPDCLIISEMIEGTANNNKAFELYNCSGGDLNLADFGVCLASNANMTCNFSASLPAQTLGAQQVVTVCKAKTGAQDDPVQDIIDNCEVEAPTVANFNGDDRLAVFRDLDGNGQLNATDTIIDVFGDLAIRPGSTIWANKTYRRCDFTPHDGLGGFDADALYTSHPINDASDYGIPPVAGCP